MFNARFCAVFALLTFAATAAASWYMQQRDGGTPSAQQAATDALPSEVPGAAAGTPAELPVAVRPKPISAEELVQLGENLRKREEALGRRGRELDAQRSRLMLSMEDIRREQQELESFQTKIQSLMTSAEHLLTDLAQKQKEFRQEREEAQKDLQARQTATEQFADTQRANIRQLAAWLAEMEPEKAAEYLRGFADDGQMDVAVEVLADLEEKDAAAILTELNDYELFAQLTGKFVTRPKEKSTKR
jgi:flagellar motility protein MotE (MotC chaperone)